MPRVINPWHAASHGSRDVEHVGHDAHGRGHGAGAAAREQARAERAALERDRVEHAVDVRDARVLPHERGVHAQLDLAPGVAPDREVLDDVAEALGEGDGRSASSSRMPSVGTRGRVDARAEGQHRQHDELVRRVVPADVELRIGLRVALLLRLGQRLIEATALPRACA